MIKIHSPETCRLSVAIPVYNFGGFLPQTLDSILDQALLENVEVLVFDGGSTDHTRLIANGYTKRYSNFRYIRALKKGGIDADMAHCVELTGTPYCWLFSGDDVMRPGAIKTVLKALQQWQPDLLLCRHNECLIDMTVQKVWPVLSINSDRLFELDKPQDRRNYFEAASSSEAFFSFMGGLIVNRSTWFKGKLNPSFKGSNWAHVGRLWQLTESPFKFGYIHTALLDRRGENDSFSSDGMLSRLDIQINGLLGIFKEIYGENSFETNHVKRVVRSEVNPHWSNAVRQYLEKKSASAEEFAQFDAMLARLTTIQTKTIKTKRKAAKRKTKRKDAKWKTKRKTAKRKTMKVNMTHYVELQRCRVSGSENLVSVLNLGCQALTGVFPDSAVEKVTEGPLELVWCPDSGLAQLKHSYDAGEMYGDNYGYRSGLNQSMVDHLTNKIGYLERLTKPKSGDTVLDIGSNDCTTLKAYSVEDLQRIGIDPTGKKFANYYPDDVALVPDFFSLNAYHSVTDKKAKIITSIAMFYDLEDPVSFAHQIENVLADDGVWHFEQSYLPSMLRLNSYDTICHEHLEYYSLSSVNKILNAADLKAVDVVMNNINGGSFAVTAVKKLNTSIEVNSTVINWTLEQEERMGLSTPRPYRDFEERVFRHREDLKRLINGLVANGKKVYGYGASTKGNVILQFCNFTSKQITAIAEVNEEKFGRVTPGTHIPIISEDEARADKPDYFLVLPWHFKDGILRREKEYLANGGKFIFPFPEIEIV